MKTDVWEVEFKYWQYLQHQTTFRLSKRVVIKHKVFRFLKRVLEGKQMREPNGRLLWWWRSHPMKRDKNNKKTVFNTHRIRMTTTGADIKGFPWITGATLILVRSRMEHMIHKEGSREKSSKGKEKFKKRRSAALGTLGRSLWVSEIEEGNKVCSVLHGFRTSLLLFYVYQFFSCFYLKLNMEI